MTTVNFGHFPGRIVLKRYRDGATIVTRFLTKIGVGMLGVAYRAADRRHGPAKVRSSMISMKDCGMLRCGLLAKASAAASRE